MGSGTQSSVDSALLRKVMDRYALHASTLPPPVEVNSGPSMRNSHGMVSLKGHLRKRKPTPAEIGADLLRSRPPPSVSAGITSMIAARTRGPKPAYSFEAAAAESILAAEILAKVRQHANLPPLAPPIIPDEEETTNAPGRPLPLVPELVKKPAQRLFPDFRPPATAIYVGLKPNERIGDYVLNRRIAQGSMSAIIEATHRLTDAKVALKIVRKRYSATDNTGACDASYDVGRFGQILLREAAVLRRLQAHPCVVKIYEVVETDEVVALALERIGTEYRRLTDRLLSDGPIEETVAKEIMRQLLSTLAFVHDQKILHKDVTTNNILVSDETDEIKLIDFGRAAQFTASRSLSEANANVSFATNDTLIGKKCVGPEIDLWGCGVCLHAMLVGKPPRTNEAVIGSHVHAFDANASHNAKPATGFHFELPPNASGDLKAFFHALLDPAFARKLRLKSIDDFLDHVWMVGNEEALVESSGPSILQRPSVSFDIRKTYVDDAQTEAASASTSSGTAATSGSQPVPAGDASSVVRTWHSDLYPQLNMHIAPESSVPTSSSALPAIDSAAKSTATLTLSPSVKGTAVPMPRKSVFSSIAEALEKPNIVRDARQSMQASGAVEQAWFTRQRSRDKVMSSRAKILQASFAAAAAASTAAAARKQMSQARLLPISSQGRHEGVVERQRREREVEEVRQVHRWVQGRMHDLGFSTTIVSKVAVSLEAITGNVIEDNDGDGEEPSISSTARRGRPELDSAAATYRLLFDSKLSEKRAALKRHNSILNFNTRLAAVKARRGLIAAGSHSHGSSSTRKEDQSPPQVLKLH
eukprot:Opistho-2@53888